MALVGYDVCHWRRRATVCRIRGDTQRVTDDVQRVAVRGEWEWCSEGDDVYRVGTVSWQMAYVEFTMRVLVWGRHAAFIGYDVRHWR